MTRELDMLMSFVVVENPKVLISGCKAREKIGLEGAYCTSQDCENVNDCVPLNLAMPFLPLRRFDVWIVDYKELNINIGYIFDLASQTLKDMGILAIFNTNPEDYIALSYGFQPLHHGNWHYFLKG